MRGMADQAASRIGAGFLNDLHDAISAIPLTKLRLLSDQLPKQEGVAAPSAARLAS
jgi:hypothetical protein